MVVSPGPMLFIYRLVSFLEHCLEDDGLSLSLSGGISLNEQPFLSQYRFILEVTMGQLISTMLVLDVMMQKQMIWALLMYLVFMNLEFKTTYVQYTASILNLLDIGIFLKPSSIMAQIPFVEPTSACLSYLRMDFGP